MAITSAAADRGTPYLTPPGPATGTDAEPEGYGRDAPELPPHQPVGHDRQHDQQRDYECRGIHGSPF